MELTDKGLRPEAINMVYQEDRKQREKWGDQTHSIYKWITILSEEVGELSKAVLEAHHDTAAWKDVVKEAVQVATLALKIAWMVQRRRWGV